MLSGGAPVLVDIPLAKLRNLGPQAFPVSSEVGDPFTLELVPQSDEIRKALERVTSTPAPKFLFMSVEKRPIMRIGRFINSLLPKKCAQAIWEIRKKLSK